MKKLSTYLFLILFSFSAPSFADDISDFQIEGMSIGDSLLDYFSANEIKNNIVINPFIKSKKFTNVQIYSQNSKIYDGFNFWYETNDKNYEIFSIGGFIVYDTNIDGCYKKLNEIDEEVSVILKDAKRWIQNSIKHPADKSGKSTIKRIYYDFKSGDSAMISCTDWSSKMDHSDSLIIIIDSKEFRDWIFPGGCNGGYCYNMR